MLVLDPFDRADEATRIPYVSAMTPLTARDGDSFDYVDLAEPLTEQDDVTIKQDLVELWRRVAFSVIMPVSGSAPSRPNRS